MLLRKIWDDLQSSLWFLPLLWVLGLGALSITLTAIDRSISQSGMLDFPWYLVGSPEGVRTMLGSISSAMLTVASLTFSIVILVIAQTAQAYSPRILRHFLGDRTNQNLLGIFVGTFLYSLLALRGVRTVEDSQFVPILTMNVAVLLSLVATIGLIYFIGHVAQSLKISNIITMVVSRTDDMMTDLYPGGFGEPWPDLSPPALPTEPPAIVLAGNNGYLQLVQEDRLMKDVIAADVVIRLEYAVGDFVLRETPLVTVWPAEAMNDRLAAAIENSLVLGNERTLVDDVLFGIRQLSDIAVRALSPGVNDPTTALDCINALAVLMINFVQGEPASPYRCDAAGRLRVIAYGPTFEEALEEGFAGIRHYGSGDPVIVLRLIQLFGALAYMVRRPTDHKALWAAVHKTMEAADLRLKAPADRRQVNKQLERTAEVFGEDALALFLEAEV